MSRSDEELLAEIEAGDGPDPLMTLTGELADVALAAVRARAAKSGLDTAIAAAMQAGHSDKEIRELLSVLE